MKKIAVTVADNKGWTRLNFIRFQQAAYDLMKNPGFPFDIRFYPVFGCSTVHFAFNNCAQCAIDHTDSDEDWWWLWDNDMEPHPQLAFHMLENLDNCDLQGAAVFNWLRFDDEELGSLNAPFVLGCDKTIGDPSFTFTTTFPQMTPYEKAACATGGLMVKRKVLTDPRMLCGPLDSPIPLFRIQEKPNGRQTMGLDLDFTYRATQLGYKLLIEPRANADHFQLLGLNSIINYGNWAAKQGFQNANKNSVTSLFANSGGKDGNQNQAVAQGTPAQEAGSEAGSKDPA